MKRLTDKDHTYQSYEFMDEGIADYINKLSKYENTLLDPDEIKQLIVAVCKNDIEEWQIKLIHMLNKNYEEAKGDE